MVLVQKEIFNVKKFEVNLKDYFIKKKEEIEKEVRPKNKI